MDMHQKRKFRKEKKQAESNEGSAKSPSSNIHWYPGHMAKATRLIREDLKNVDVIIKLCDARAVVRSDNKDFNSIISQKKIIRIYNKMDLADDKITKEWILHFKEKNEEVFFIDCLNKKGLSEVVAYLTNMNKSFRSNREVRAMVIGVPNVGKSMFINSITKKSNAKTGNRPGVTLGKQWVKVSGEFFLLDTPGVLPPKFESEKDGVVVASIGSVKDSILDRENLALNLIDFLKDNYPNMLMDRYKLEELDENPLVVYEEIAMKRGFLIKGGEVDYTRTATTILDEFKNGKIGKISFDKVTVSQIKEIVKSTDIKEYKSLISHLMEDSRSSVRNIIASLNKAYHNFLKEVERIENMKAYELSLYNKGFSYIGGVDEVGRGPLCGPVVSACVILKKDSELLYINDSKKIRESLRMELYEKIKKEAVSIGIGVVDNKEIDESNILIATKKSMKMAVENLDIKPEILLIDALKIDTDIPQEAFIKGDERIYSIGASSIVAKCYRDALMGKYHEKYPYYNLASNKGYGTKEHIEAIKKYGPCDIHRNTFIKDIVKETLSSKEKGNKYEGIACNYLKGKGFEILSKNYHCAFGEIDIIVKKDNKIRFIEVKGGSSLSVPREKVDYKKMKKIIDTAKVYIEKNNIDLICSFDVMEIKDNNDGFFKVNYLKDAFREDSIISL